MKKVRRQRITVCIKDILKASAIIFAHVLMIVLLGCAILIIAEQSDALASIMSKLLPMPFLVSVRIKDPLSGGIGFAFGLSIVTMPGFSKMLIKISQKNKANKASKIETEVFSNIVSYSLVFFAIMFGLTYLPEGFEIGLGISILFRFAKHEASKIIRNKKIKAVLNGTMSMLSCLFNLFVSSDLFSSSVTIRNFSSTGISSFNSDIYSFLRKRHCEKENTKSMQKKKLIRRMSKKNKASRKDALFFRWMCALPLP